jgi:hypothetical protein
MQSSRILFERLTLLGLDKVVEMVRQAARREGRGGSRQLAEQLGAVNEFLLRPARVLVEALAEGGLSKVEPSPVQAAAFDAPVPDEPLSVGCPKCGAARGMRCTSYKKHPKAPCRERKRCVDKWALPDHPAWAAEKGGA